MNYAKRILASVLVLALLIGAPLAAYAYEGTSAHGAFAAELSGSVFMALYTGSSNVLYSVPAEGGEMKQLDSASELDELVAAGGYVYYLRTEAGMAQIVRVDAEGTLMVLCEFEKGATLSNLSWYDDILYCLVGGRLYLIDPEKGDFSELSDVQMDDYVIVSDVIFYVDAGASVSYERVVSGQDTPVQQSAGTLWSMSILGTNPEKLVDKGVTNLSAYGTNLYFHNLEDNYVMGSTDDMWLEGKLYRYNIETGQMSSLNLNYDWDYIPTESGLVVYTSQDISLYPLTGGEGTQLMTPEQRTALGALGGNAYVFEYTSGKLTRLPLDGSEPVVLADDSDVLPSVNEAPDDTIIVDEDGNPVDEEDQVGDSQDETEDVPEDDEDDEDSSSSSSGGDSSYIFPNSSKKKLTRKQVLAIDKGMWGYARNEIYARHGYQFKKSKYAKYFKKKSWYKPGGFSSSDLSSIEWYNMELIRDLEQEYGLLGSTSSSGSSGNSGAENNYYVLKEASSKKLTKSYIKKKLGGSKSKYALARNEILARHGYVFETAKYKKYFSNQKWYKPGGYSSGKLSNTEWYNIEQLKDLENS